MKLPTSDVSVTALEVAGLGLDSRVKTDKLTGRLVLSHTKEYM